MREKMRLASLSLGNAEPGFGPDNSSGAAINIDGRQKIKINIILTTNLPDSPPQPSKDHVQWTKPSNRSR